MGFSSSVLSHINEHFICSPSLGKVGPVSHNYCAQHHVILGEVTVEQIGGTHHGHAKHIGHLHTHTHTHTHIHTCSHWNDLHNTFFPWAVTEIIAVSRKTHKRSGPTKLKSLICVQMKGHPYSIT